MKIAITYKSYNSRRYGKPWIARIISWPTGKQPDLEWGVYVGHDKGGFAEIEATPGSIIRDGQKDHRKPHASTNDWSVVEEDGSLRQVTPLEARKIWDAKPHMFTPSPMAQPDIPLEPKAKPKFAPSK
jgi:hypothetical protein